MLSSTDIVVLLISVIASLAVGLFFAYRSHAKATFVEYFLGGRSLHYIPVAISLTVTFESSILILGHPAEVYIYGFSHALMVVGIIASLAFATYIALPVFYKMGLTSIYDYITQRFQTNVEHIRIYLVFLGAFVELLYMAIVLLGPAFVFDALLNVPLWVSILGSAVVATVYTSLGGMRAVVWTDAFQFFIMIVGMLAMLIKVSIVVGGIENMIAINQKYDRMKVIDFNLDPRVRHTVWTLTIGAFFFTFGMAIAPQTVQRFNSTKSLVDARKVILLFTILYSFLHVLGDVCGLAAFAYYSFIGCDPLESGRIKNPNQIVIAMISDLFTDIPGLAGLLVSAVISASLSTLSSGYNSLAAITCQELFQHKFKDWKQSRKTMSAKVMVAIYGFLSTLLAIAMMYMPGSFAQMTISLLGALTAPKSGTFLVCLLYKRARPNSVFAGGLVALLFSSWLSIGFNFSPTLLPTPWLQPGPTDRCQLTNNSRYMPHYQNLTNITDATYMYNITASGPKQDGRTQAELDDVNRYQPYNTTSTFDNATSKWSNFSEENTTGTLHTSDYYDERKTEGEENTDRAIEGLDNFYSISYQYFTIIPILATIATALVIDACMSRKRRGAYKGGCDESIGLNETRELEVKDPSVRTIQHFTETM